MLLVNITQILIIGDFTLLISAIQTSCKFISSKVRRSGIANLNGLTGHSLTESGYFNLNIYTLRIEAIEFARNGQRSFYKRSKIIE